jgi:hypothetical protein
MAAVRSIPRRQRIRRYGENPQFLLHEDLLHKTTDTPSVIGTDDKRVAQTVAGFDGFVTKWVALTNANNPASCGATTSTQQVVTCATDAGRRHIRPEGALMSAMGVLRRFFVGREDHNDTPAMWAAISRPPSALHSYPGAVPRTDTVPP